MKWSGGLHVPPACLVRLVVDTQVRPLLFIIQHKGIYGS